MGERKAWREEEGREGDRDRDRERGREGEREGGERRTRITFSGPNPIVFENPTPVLKPGRWHCLLFEQCIYRRYIDRVVNVDIAALIYTLIISPRHAPAITRSTAKQTSASRLLASQQGLDHH